MKNLILLLALILLASSCVTQKRCNRKFPPTVTTITNTITETILRDTIVYVTLPADTVFSPGDTVYIDIETGLATSKKSELETEYAKSWAQVVNGILLHELIQKDAEVEQRIKDAIREHSTHTVSETTIVKKKPVRGVIWWTGLVAIIAVVSYVAIRIILVKAII